MLKRRRKRSRLLAPIDTSHSFLGARMTSRKLAKQTVHAYRPEAVSNSHKALMKTQTGMKGTKSLQLIALVLASIKLSLIQVAQAHFLQDNLDNNNSSSSSQQQMALVANRTSGVSGNLSTGQDEPQLGMAELNPDDSDTVPVYMQRTTTVLVFLHLSVFVTGLVGNSLVCLSVYRNKSLQTITNYYIVNLAVADFLVILICLPPTVYWDLTLTWNFGLVLCKLVPYLQVSIAPTLTCACIALTS